MSTIEISTTHTEQFLNLADEFIEGVDGHFPTNASYLGIHDYDGALDAYDPAGMKSARDFLCEHYRKFVQIDPRHLAMERQVEYVSLTTGIKSALRFFDRTREWARDPNHYIDLALHGIHILLVREFAPLDDRLESVTSRLEQLPGLLAEARANLENPAQINTHSAIQATAGAISMLDTLIPELAAQAGDSVKERLLKANARAHSAILEYRSYLENELLGRSDGNFALGEELFNELLKEEHLLDYNTDQLWDLGHRMLEETESELKALVARTDPGKSWKQKLKELKADLPPADRLLETYRDEMGRARRFMEDYDLVDVPPGESIEMMPTPEFQRHIIPYAAYMPPGPFESRQQAQFWVTPVPDSLPKKKRLAYMGEHCRGKIQYVSLHEAYPGHHLQLVKASTISSSILKRSFSTVFIEGWAFYCEQLMKEMGYFDISGQFAQLEAQLWRAARVVVDVGLHTGRMTFDQAVDFMVKRAHAAKVSTEAEVRRYVRTPTQPMSYYIGKLEILKIREAFKEKMKDAFTLKEFHHQLLSSGSLPPALIRYRMGLGSLPGLAAVGDTAGFCPPAG